MPTPSKTKGNSYERELKNQAAARGLTAERAWGSNGRALGEVEGVDLTVAGCRVQAKRRKALAKYLEIPEGCDVTAIRQDRGETYVLMRWEDFLDKLAEAGW